MRSLLLTALVVIASAGTGLGDPPAAKDSRPHPIRIGAVAYGPSVVTVFDGIRRHARERGLEVDYVLYSNYDSLVQALSDGQVEIAWNTPLAHARAHCKLGDQSKTLVMRDVDCGFRSVLVARTSSGIKGPGDLSGKSLVLGSHEAAEATILPLSYLERQGICLDPVKMIELDRERDFAGNPCSSPEHVLAALREGRGDAGIVGERLWQSLSESDRSGLAVVWTSPAFSHCVFTARPDLPEEQSKQFVKVMTTMSPDDPKTAEAMRLEGTRAWVKGSPDGFRDLIEALKSGDKYSR